MGKEILKQKTRLACVHAKEQKLRCPQPCVPEPANTQPTGALLVHPGLPPGLTSRYAGLEPVPQPPAPAIQTPPVERSLGCITGECRQRPGREDFYPPRGSGLESELLQQAICLKSSIPRIFRDQRNGLLLLEPYANEPPDRLFVRPEKRLSVILTMERSWCWCF